MVLAQCHATSRPWEIEEHCNKVSVFLLSSALPKGYKMQEPTSIWRGGAPKALGRPAGLVSRKHGVWFMYDHVAALSYFFTCMA